MSHNTFKIAFDAKRLFHNREGLGSYARTLVSNMQALLPQHTYYLCTPDLGDNAYAQDFFDDSKYRHITAPTKANKSIWRTQGIVKDLRRHEIDVYWGLSNELPIGITQVGCKSLVTVHDLFYRYYPQQFGWLDRWVVGRKYRHAVNSADKVIVTSQHTHRDLIRAFPKVEQVEVLYQSTAYEDRQPQIDPQAEPYYLMVGSITPRKNLALVVDTYAQLPPEERLKVRIVGRLTKYADQLKSTMARLGVESCFEFLGQVSNEDLWRLYSNAYALVFPSRYEGFGIPVLESLTAGVPVIGSSRSSIPEVIGKHGIVIEYDSTESLRAAFIKLKETRASLLDGVDGHLKSFAKETTIQQVAHILSDLMHKA